MYMKNLLLTTGVLITTFLAGQNCLAQDRIVRIGKLRPHRATPYGINGASYCGDIPSKAMTVKFSVVNEDFEIPPGGGPEFLTGGIFKVFFSSGEFKLELSGNCEKMGNRIECYAFDGLKRNDRYFSTWLLPEQDLRLSGRVRLNLSVQKASGGDPNSTEPPDQCNRFYVGVIK